jgi:50S ribosomal subunit-associated GTPase HflX
MVDECSQNGYEWEGMKFNPSFRDVENFLIIFDATSEFYEKVYANIVEKVRDCCSYRPNIFLVANKIDLIPDFDMAKVCSFAGHHRINCTAISAKNGINVENLMENLLLNRLNLNADQILQTKKCVLQ